MRSHTTHRYPFLLFSISTLILSVILMSCGYGSPGSRYGFRQGGSGGFGGNVQLGDTYQGGGGTYNPGDVGYSAELKRCDQLRELADSITVPCGGIIQQAVAQGELSETCYDWFNELYDYNCNGLETRLRNALQACSQELSQYFNLLPAACQNSLRRFFK